MNKLQTLTLSLLTSLLISGCSTSQPEAPIAKDPEPKGPIWGEGAESKQEYLDVERMNTTRPTTLGNIYYSPNPPQGSEVESPAFAQGHIGFAIYDRYGKKIPVIQVDGNYYIKSQTGQRYSIYFENLSRTGYEVLISTDGIDSITGHEAKYSNPGYILFPGAYMKITGFRQTQKELKPFRFDEKDSPFLPEANKGTAANVGVIGFAIFELKTPNIATEKTPNAFPAEIVLPPL